VAEMWNIALLLVVSFVLMVFGRIAKKRTMFTVLRLLGCGAWMAAVFLSIGRDYALTILSLLCLFSAVSDAIAVPVFRRRAIPPCVREKRSWRYVAIVIASYCFGAAILIYLMVLESRRSLNFALNMAPLVPALIISAVLSLFERTEICANGVLLGSRLSPWEDYESFAWEQKKDDKVELRLKRKSDVWQWLRLVVSPENHEAAQKILVAHLPDTSAEKVEA
jgi:hypothetical protein